jgi:gas vesicle protein
MRKFTAFLSGAILGGLVGSVLALLLTPVSGKTLRQQTVEYFETLTNEVRKAAAERRNELEGELHRLRQSAVKLE